MRANRRVVLQSISCIVLLILAVSALLTGCTDDQAPLIPVWSYYRTPEIGGRSIHDVHGNSRDNAWAVGQDGVIFYYDGLEWVSFEDTPTNDNIRALSVYNDGKGWAVGDYGLALSLNITSWRVSPSPTGEDLFDVAMGSGGYDDAWAVGNGGVIIHYDGNSWKQVDHNLTNSDLRGIDISSADEIVVVGNEGVILQKSGPTSGWTLATSPVSSKLNSVNISSAGTFACGDSGVILKKENNGWVIVNQNNNEVLRTMDINAEGVGFIAGTDDAFYEMYDTSWIPGTLPQNELESLNIYGIYLIDKNNGWAVGSAGTILKRGIAY